MEENIGVNLCDLGLGSDFLDITSKAQGTKRKIDKFVYLPKKGDNMIKKVFFPGHGSTIALRMC